MIYFCIIFMSESFLDSILADKFVDKYFNTSYELNKDKLMSHVNNLIKEKKVKDIKSYYSLLNSKGNKTKEVLFRKLQETWIVNNLGLVLIEYAQRTGDVIDNVVDLEDFFDICKSLYDSNIRNPLPNAVFIFIKLYYIKPVSKTFDDLDFMELYQRALKMINPSDEYLSKPKNIPEKITTKIIEATKVEATKVEATKVEATKVEATKVEAKPNSIEEIISNLLKTNPRFVETWYHYEEFLDQEIVIDSNLILQYLNQFKEFNEDNIKDLKILYKYYEQSMKISTIKNNYNILYMLIKDDIIKQSKDSFDIGLMKSIGIEKNIIIEFI